MLKEFRDFLMRRNLVELAVAFVMGIAVSDEERRHQELLAAIRGISR
jgi:hypothetical protein